MRFIVLLIGAVLSTGALQVAQDSDREAAPRALIAQGDQARMRGRYPQALALYESARAAAERDGDGPAQSAALNGIANTHVARGAYDLALSHAQQGLALTPESTHSAEAAAAMLTIGHTYRLRSNYPAALDWFQRSLAIQQQLGEPAALGGALSAIGIVYRQQGRLDEAAEHYERALALLRPTTDLSQTARTLNNLGVLHVARGDFEAALVCYRESLQLHERLEYAPNVASTLSNIGIVHRQQGNNRLALEYYRRSLAITEQTGDRPLIAQSLKAIGVLYSSQGNAALALEYFEKALTINEALGNRSESALLQTNIAARLSGRGDYDAALALFEGARHTREAIGDRAGVADSWNAIGAMYENQGALDRAVTCYEKSLTLHEALGDQRMIAENLTRLQRAYARQGQHARSLDTATRALTVSRTIGDRERLWRSLLGVAQARRALGEPALARESLDESIAVVESLRGDAAGAEPDRERAFEPKVAPYQALASLLIEEGKPAEALRIAERAKARVLLDVLGQGRLNVTKAMTTEEQQEERAIDRELVALNAQIAYRSRANDATLAAELTRRLQAAQGRREAFRAGLYSAHPDLKVQRSDVSPFALADAEAVIADAPTAILEYVVMDQTTYVFVVTRNVGTRTIDVRVAAIPISRAALTARVTGLREQLASRDPAFLETSTTLFSLLVAPARAHLSDARRLIIVPDGILWELPFQALAESGGSSQRYLLEQYAISYASSITVLREMARLQPTRAAEARAADERAHAQPRLLAFANPLLPASSRSVASDTERGAPLVALPHAEQEARALARVYGPSDSRIYIGAAAREDRWKAEAGDFDVLHIATHGVLDAASPLYSYVALAPSAGEQGKLGKPGEDGLLQAWELMTLTLHAELVVLSGCETARGRVSAGEGLIGLSWALFVAGSPASIVSQWNVESASTAQLMQTFHQRWRAKNPSTGARLSKAEALQQAALPLLRSTRYRHPFYWAAFVLVGDGS